MIEGTRTMLQMSIDDRSAVIERIITNLTDIIHAQFRGFGQDAEKVATDNCGGDKDVYNSIFYNALNASRPEDEEWMIEE